MTPTQDTEQYRPNVLVLMATHNGARWVRDQLRTILAQEQVVVGIQLCDDTSTDTTHSEVHRLAKGEPRVQVLRPQRHGSAAGNFFELISQSRHQQPAVSLVALADQDDLWYPDKLAWAAEAIASGRCEAVSTSVVAFWPDGRRKLINKGQSQRTADHWFESAGPGCTYVLRADVARELGAWVAAHREALRGIDFHDWLIYAWVRSRGHRWWIDPRPSMDYRQHDHNVLGAHAGLSGLKKRLAMLLGGWYLQQVLRIAEVCGAQSHPLLARLRRDRWYDRLYLVCRVGQMRRKPLDRLALAAALLFGRRNPV